MAQPITILPVDVDRNNIDGPGSYYVRRARAKQARPYNLPAPYRRDNVFTTVATLKRFSSWGGQANASSNSNWPKPGPDFPQFAQTGHPWALNTARDKFLSSVREEAMLAVNLAERKQALSMITSRAQQLVRFTTALRRGRLGDAMGALHLSSSQIPQGQRWRRSRSISNTFLEFHFGWEPLVKDMWTAANLLSRPVAWPRVSAKGRRQSWNYSAGTGNVGPTETYSRTFSEGSCSASVGAEIYVSDPNLWLLNQLGLLNPAAIGWELVPWSFVWDWFFNFGDWLNQWTDFMGLTLQNSWHSVKTRNPKYSYLYHDYFGGEWQQYAEMQGTWFERKLGIPSVTLGKIPYRPLSAVRAVTAASLLVQKLPSREARPHVSERRFQNIAHPAWYASYLR